MSDFAKRLIDAVMFDLYPSMSVCCDYGIETNAIYTSFQRAVRSGQVVEEDLLKALGNGPALTKLLNACECNQGVDRQVTVTTPYDEMGPRS
jgi:hypothetical protein